MVDKACRNCGAISNLNKCPKCNSATLSDDYSGFVIIFDPENSEIAQAMKKSKKGKYAIRIR